MQTRVYRMWMWVREWHVCTCADVLSTAESTHAHANIPAFISYNSTSKLLFLYLRLSCKSDYANWKRRHAVWRDASWRRICVLFNSSLGRLFTILCLFVDCLLIVVKRKRIRCASSNNHMGSFGAFVSYVRCVRGWSINVSITNVDAVSLIRLLRSSSRSI